MARTIVQGSLGDSVADVSPDLTGISGVDPEWMQPVRPVAVGRGAGYHPGSARKEGSVSWIPFDEPLGPDVHPLEDPFVEVPSNGPVDSDLDRQVLIDTVHDGHVVPEAILPLSDQAWSDFRDCYGDERDWGSHYVATSVARHLGLSGYKRVLLARPLLDFNRFAGINELPLGHDHRDAIFPPMSGHLDRRRTRILLEQGYDRIDDRMESWIEGRQVKLSVHTYRPSNEIGTERPAVSLITQSVAYDRQTDLRQASFYEFYPRQLVEFTADRMLTYRIATYLERGFVPTGLNSPYMLPEGAVELRAQVWLFVRFLRERYERDGRCPVAPGTREYEAIWNMLGNTNRRSAEAISLREQLHGSARVPRSQDLDFGLLQDVYDDIRRYLRENGGRIVWDYRFSPDRMSTIIVEVRRDFILRMEAVEGRMRPTQVHGGRVDEIGERIASAIRDYLRDDLPLRRRHFERGPED